MTDIAIPQPDLEALFNPQSTEFIEDPYASYARARGLGAVLPVMSAGGHIVLGPTEISAVLNAPTMFTSRTNLDGAWPFAPECKEILDRSLFFHIAYYNLEPPAQTGFRNFIGAWFTPRRIRELEPAMRDLAESLVADFRADGHADLMAQFAGPFPTTIIYDLIGVPVDDRAQVMSWHMDWLILQVVPLPAEQQVRCANSVLAYEAYIRGLLEARANDPRDDMLTLFAQEAARPDATYTIADAIVAIRVTLAAGHETTTGALGSTVWHLLENRKLWELLVSDPSMIPMAVEEGLRYDPPIQALNRVTNADALVGDVLVPAGGRVCPMIAAVGRDESRVEAADEFLLNRRGPSRHHAFGMGVHFCIGAPLARAELRIALEVLTQALPDLEFAADAAIGHLPGGITFHRLAALPVVWGAAATENGPRQ